MIRSLKALPMNTLRNSILCLMVVLLAGVAFGQGTYTQIDFPGALSTEVLGINSAGNVTGSYQDSLGTWHAFLLSGGSFTTIDAPNTTSTFGFGLNDSGKIVGTTYDGLGFIYDIATQQFQKVRFPGSTFNVPTCINNSGTIAGYFKHFGSYVEFQVSGLSYSRIVPPGATTTLPSGITASGTVVGSANIDHASTNINFSLSQNQFTPIRIPGVSHPGINGINNLGDAIVGSYQPSLGTSAGFLWTNNTLQTLQFPGALESAATAVNDGMEVVGYFFDASNAQHGFLWTPPADFASK